MLNNEQNEAYKVFGAAMNGNGVLDAKTAYMVRMSAAMVLGCYPCMEFLFTNAEENGVSQDEIDAVLGIAMVVSAGVTRNKAQDAYETRVANV